MLYWRSRLLSAALAIALTALSASSSRTVGAKSRKAETRTSRVPGVSVEFKAKNLKKGASEAVELRAILDSTATLTVKSPFAYLRSSLPSGAHPVKIEQTAEKKWYFVVGEKPAEKETGDRSAARNASTAAMGIAGRLARHLLDGESGAPEESKSPPGRRRTGSTGEDPARKRAKEPKEQEKGGWLRARVRFSKVTKPESEVVFEVRSLDRGARFQLSIRAGATLGKASFRLVAEKEKKTTAD